MTVSVDILQQMPLLATLPKVTLAELSKTSEIKTFNKREVVLTKGSSPQHLMFLFDGRLQGVDFTMDGKEVGCYFADPGDFFGELGVMDGQTHPETVIAIVKSVVVLVPRHLIRPMMTSMPSMAEALTLKLSQKLRQAAAQRRILGLSNPLQKVCAQLWVLAQSRLDQERPGIKAPQALASLSAPEPQSTQIPLMPTHQELAIMINASRETVTRVFQLLQTQSIVQREGNDLLILDLPALKAISEGSEIAR